MPSSLQNKPGMDLFLLPRKEWTGKENSGPYTGDSLFEM